MLTEIYYFSGSGNSLHVARELQKRLPESRLVSIISLLNLTKIEARGNIIGFVFPQHASQMPEIVIQFISKMDLRSSSYIFAIATRGGTPCKVFPELDKILERYSFE